MAMSPMVMYLGLAAVVAVLFFMFVIPEMKSRVGGKPPGLVNHILSQPNKGLYTNQSHDLVSDLFETNVGPAERYHEKLYALGGGHGVSGSKSKPISDEDSEDRPVPIPERHDFSSPYARNDAHFTKSHGHLPAKHWEKKFKHHNVDAVTNHHSRHHGRAGHGLHEVHN